MPYRPPYVDPDAILVQPPHPATLEPEKLLKQCEFIFGRGSGPGGQNRNKVETGARILHRPTGLESKATERRQQQVNRHVAIGRLRLRLALKARTATSRDGHRPSELWSRRRQGTRLPVNPRHADYPALLAEALDLIKTLKAEVERLQGLLSAQAGSSAAH